MKKGFYIILFLLSVLSYSQTVEIEEEFSVYRTTSSFCVKDVCFSVVNGRDKDTNQYESRLYLGGENVGSLISRVSQHVEFFHVYNNQLVLLFSGKRKMSETREVYSNTLKDYTLVSYFLDGRKGINIKELKSLSVDTKPNLKFSHHNYSCFLYKNDEQLKLITFTDDVAVSDVEIPKELIKRFSKLKSDDLQEIDIDTYSIDIGAPLNRLYMDTDFIYLTYMLPKSKTNIICKLFRKENVFSWFGYSELDFVFDKKVKKYNSYLLDRVFYLVERRKKQIYLTTLDLDTNTSLKYDLTQLALDEVINKFQLDRITNFFSGSVPSVMVYNQKDTEDKIIKIASIARDKTYNNFMFHHEFMQNQHNMMHQNMMNNIKIPAINYSMPGGFRVVKFPAPGFWGEEPKVVRFIMSKKGDILDYDDEQPSLVKRDYVESYELITFYIKNKVSSFKKKYISFDWLENGNLYYTYFDSKSRNLMMGVKNKE